jgi:hypothetical protein
MSATTLPQFAIVGQYKQGTNLVKHVGVLQCTMNLKPGDRARVYHVEPGASFAADDFEFSTELLTSIPGGLKPRQITIGERWIKRIRTQIDRLAAGTWPAKNWTAHPPHPGSAQVALKRSRYSCIGFVMHLFQTMRGVPLLQHDHPGMPRMSRAELEEIYGTYDEAELKGVGLPPDEEPWPVIVPGYVFHACDLDAPAFPYIPNSTEERKYPLS